MVSVRAPHPQLATRRAKHLKACAQGSAEVAEAVRRAHGGNDSAFSGALAGLTTQSLGVIVQGSDVVIGSLQLTARDCGWLAGSHSNVCFYMSCTDGNTTDALALKRRLAGLATALAQARLHLFDQDRLPDFSALSRKAEEQVFMAFAMLVGPICVVNTVASAGEAILYTVPDRMEGNVTFVTYVPEHFQRLDGPPTTVDQLRSAATQAGPVHPGPGLRPRPLAAAAAARPAAAQGRGRPRSHALQPPLKRTRQAPPAPRPRVCT